MRRVTSPAPCPPDTGGDRDPNCSEERQDPIRVLVVDDNLDSALSLSMWLKLKGCETEVAHDGMAALSVAERFDPSVVLLDIGLPKLDGYEVCRRIRAAEWGRSIRVFALTGWGQEDDKQATADSGFDAHLVKPVDLKSLYKLLTTPAS